jgi:hypothetical protein
MATTKIGPTFDAELLKAGLLGLPFTWGSDGTFIYGPGMTTTQKNQVQAVYAAHIPAQSDLLDYSHTSAILAMSGGITVGGVATSVDAERLQLMHLQYTSAQNNPGLTYHVINIAYVATSYSASGLINLFNTCNGYRKSVNDMEASVSGSIIAGTITTNAQIDAQYATLVKVF